MPRSEASAWPCAYECAGAFPSWHCDGLAMGVVVEETTVGVAVGRAGSVGGEEEIGCTVALEL